MASASHLAAMASALPKCQSGAIDQGVGLDIFWVRIARFLLALGFEWSGHDARGFADDDHICIDVDQPFGFQGRAMNANTTGMNVEFLVDFNALGGIEDAGSIDLHPSALDPGSGLIPRNIAVELPYDGSDRLLGELLIDLETALFLGHAARRGAEPGSLICATTF